MEMLFSVVVPVYNMASYLETCVESVISQITDNTPGMEVILVDDGSTDQSGLICDKYEASIPFVKVIHQKNRGLLQARRSGYRHASGKYIINLDSDDILHEHAIEILAKIIEQTKVDVIFYNLLVMDEFGSRPYYSNVFTDRDGCMLDRKQIMEYYFTAEIPVITSMAGKVFKRECLDMSQDYSAYGKMSMGEDTLQTAEVISKASSFYYLNKNLYIYRIGSGMTTRFDPNYYKTFKRIIVDIFSREGFVDDEYRILYDEKIVLTGCRAIAQSKSASQMSYYERKMFVKSIVDDKAFKDSLGNINIAEI